MLCDLRVKNLALIEKAEVSFTEGLNILTGETGAGKSIILGSVNMALGGKTSRDMIRTGAESAYVELLFTVEEEEKRQALRALDVELPEDGTLIVSRKIMASRSLSKINDETVTAGRLRQITGLLMDIHGQHEHQSLLYKSKHLEILDAYAKGETGPLKGQIAGYYHQYQELNKKLSEMDLDQESRMREADFLRFEIEEIQSAGLREGEEEELAAEYRRLSHAQRIVECLGEANRILDGQELGRALREVSQAAEYDEGLLDLRDQLSDAEAILNDAARELTGYMDSFTFDEEAFRQMEKRLDQIRNLEAKYGGSVTAVKERLEEKRKRLLQLEDFDQVKERLGLQLSECEAELKKFCGQLSRVRRAAGEKLAKEIRAALADLNFIDVQFTMEFTRLDHYTAGGYDEAEFLISTNPGMPVRLIFDEIDTGISGRTAQKVSEKLACIAEKHQVICITHLPQIAAMADSHFEIVKSASGGATTTCIRKLSREESCEELARLLGGAEITGAVRQNAAEMKRLAEEKKHRRM